jgi:hypothetical protein
MANFKTLNSSSLQTSYFGLENITFLNVQYLQIRGVRSLSFFLFSLLAYLLAMSSLDSLCRGLLQRSIVLAYKDILILVLINDSDFSDTDIDSNIMLDITNFSYPISTIT